MSRKGYKHLVNNAYIEPPTLELLRDKGYSFDDDESMDEVPLFEQDKTIIEIKPSSLRFEKSHTRPDCFYTISILIVTFFIVFGTWWTILKLKPH